MRESPGAPHLVHVVVPARDEARSLPRHLASVRVASEAARAVAPEVRVRATVVLDSCTDESARVLAGYPWLDVDEVHSGVVGEVRAHGVERARRMAAGVDPSRVWIACTDADTVVPEHWLSEQLRLAGTGCALVVGTVHPDPEDVSPEVLRLWRTRHRLREGHDHVHGANLGFTLAAYDAAGGFPPVRTAEDVALVARMREAKVPWCSTARTQVMTSGRRRGRAPQGFATYLRALAAEEALIVS